MKRGGSGQTAFAQGHVEAVISAAMLRSNTLRTVPKITYWRVLFHQSEVCIMRGQRGDQHGCCDPSPNTLGAVATLLSATLSFGFLDYVVHACDQLLKIVHIRHLTRELIRIGMALQQPGGIIL